MILLTAALDFAADHLLTVVWLKGTLFIGLLMLLATRWRGWPAALRSALWTLAVASLLLLGALQWMTPQVGPAPLDFPVVLFRQPLWDLAGFSSPAPSSWAGLASTPAARLLATIWLAGAAFLLARLAAQVMALRRMAADATPLPGLSTEGAARIGCSAHVESPLTFGWRHPQVLLPLDACEWPRDRLAAVLAHELAHVRRRDYVTLLLAEIARAVYWPNPLAWRLSAAVRAELECACDDEVLRGGVAPVEYVTHLVSMAAGPGRLSTHAVLPMARRSLVRARVRAILDPGLDRRQPTWREVAAAAVLSLSLVTGIAAAAMWACTLPPDAIVSATR